MTTEDINKILNISESYQATSKLMKILFDEDMKNEIFKKFLEIEHDVSYDWFVDYFQSEHADRKGFKQDFTPKTVTQLMTLLAGDKTNNYFESACGSGSILIKHWNQTRLKVNPFEYDPRNYWHHLEEYSDRVLPFLLFNMAIRGMNGIVMHGDSLERKFKNVYFIRNNSSDFLRFSEVIIMPQSDDVAKELNVKEWINEK